MKPEPGNHAAAQPQNRPAQSLIPALLMLVAAFCIYAPALRGDWLWDDGMLVTHNINLRGFHGLWDIWFAPGKTDYWPLSWTAFWIEWHLWGSHPFGFHLCSVVLHVLSGFLIWSLLEKLGLRRGWIGGLLFVIHPLAVESVAWISEIKNTLSLPFYLLALDAFIDADRVETKSSGYLHSVLYYLAAMLCKTSTVMLPVVLLLYCWWKRNKITWHDIKRTIPYVLIALVLGVATLHFQDSQTPDDPAVVHRDVFERLVGAGTVTLFYFKQFVLPVELIPIYPRWSISPPSFLQILTLPLLVILPGVFWNRRHSWGRHALLGFGFFLINLFPVMGFLKMSYMNITWAADHLVYLPMIGLIGLVAAGIEVGYRRLPGLAPAVLGTIVSVIAGILTWQSHAYAKNFANETTLWTYTIQHNPKSWDAHTMLGAYLLEKGLVDDAEEQYEIALELEPNFCVSHDDMGDVLSDLPGRLPDAIAEYEAALKLDSDYPRACVDLGNALAKDGRPAEATDEYEAALKLDPGDYRAHVALADILANTPGRLPDAAAEYRAALRINSFDPKVHNNLGGVLTTLPGCLPEAISELRTALKMKPDFIAAHFNLAVALSKNPASLPEAISEYEAVLHASPDDVGANYNLAVALADIPGRSSEALNYTQTVLREKPDFEPAQQLLMRLQANQK